VHPYIEDCIAQKEPLIKVSFSMAAGWMDTNIQNCWGSGLCHLRTETDPLSKTSFSSS
jgi:hypothetical protein